VGPVSIIADIALVENDVYNDYRERVILAAQDADPGSVFAYEAVSEDKSIFTQWLWEFQDRLPAPFLQRSDSFT